MDDGMQVSKATWYAPMVCLALLFIGCKDLAGPQGPYESIFFKRDGGGNKEFYVTTNASTHEIFFKVVRYGFRDTNYTESVFVSDNGALSEAISRVLDNHETIAGDFKQPEAITGTWVSLYVVESNNIKAEITNERIRDELMILETLVENGR
jgi:hypothetical protein